MSVPSINEESAGVFEFECYDKDNVLDVPTNIYYQIDCLTSGAAIRAQTEVTPAASSGSIDLLPADTTLQSQDNETELKLLTIVFDLNLDSQFYKTFLFEVINLKAIT